VWPSRKRIAITLKQLLSVLVTDVLTLVGVSTNATS
jgi:hypothetical protein